TKFRRSDLPDRAATYACTLHRSRSWPLRRVLVNALAGRHDGGESTRRVCNCVERLATSPQARCPMTAGPHKLGLVTPFRSAYGLACSVSDRVGLGASRACAFSPIQNAPLHETMTANGFDVTNDTRAKPESRAGATSNAISVSRRAPGQASPSLG